MTFSKLVTERNVALAWTALNSFPRIMQEWKKLAKLYYRQVKSNIDFFVLFLFCLVLFFNFYFWLVSFAIE